ncbi:hypothetical protein [[Phormidium] sp. ETS-05]|uniref:hypothetical protein n=1 Tax=[Phormidium] sp. ETS-05 TaxID=222819 RepID=UPI0018EEEDA6|nr:hypothetical protein [[Phormidium] sp. ETS-05]
MPVSPLPKDNRRYHRSHRVTTTEAGGTANFTVVLNTQPTADVTINLSGDNPAEVSIRPV